MAAAVGDFTLEDLREIWTDFLNIEESSDNITALFDLIFKELGNVEELSAKEINAEIIGIANRKKNLAEASGDKQSIARIQTIIKLGGFVDEMAFSSRTFFLPKSQRDNSFLSEYPYEEKEEKGCFMQ